MENAKILIVFFPFFQLHCYCYLYYHFVWVTLISWICFCVIQPYSAFITVLNCFKANIHPQSQSAELWFT